jgi:hypothetical protein
MLRAEMGNGKSISPRRLASVKVKARSCRVTLAPHEQRVRQKSRRMIVLNRALGSSPDVK